MHILSVNELNCLAYRIYVELIRVLIGFGYMRVLVLAGGTGGHIFPALAVAKRLIEQGHTVHWLGTSHGMESWITADHNIPIHFIQIGGLRGKNFITKLLAPWRLLVALCQSICVIMRFNPQVVLGMGGYVTGPAGLAAWLLRKKLIIHEQNAIAGMTNKILANFSYQVLTGFPRSFPRKITAKLTGNPVREDFYKLLPPQQRASKAAVGQLKILVFGGSAGARTLNNIIPQLYATWPEAIKPQILHQTGNKNINDAKQAYTNSGVVENSDVQLVDFIQDMPSAYTWADVVICRAGALTVAELAASGVASILIPYPYAVDDHQTKNAEYLANAGAAVIIQERDLSVASLTSYLVDFSRDTSKLNAMAAAAYSLARPDALDLVVASCIST